MSDLFDVRIDYILGNSNDDSSIKKFPEDLQQIGAWAVEDDLNETIKTFLALDSYGQSVVEKIIKSEYVRCREQKTVVDTSNITVGIHINKAKRRCFSETPPFKYDNYLVFHYRKIHNRQIILLVLRKE